MLLILFILTVGVVGWFGYMLTNQQDQQIRYSQINRSEQSLELIQNNINLYLHSKEKKISEFFAKNSDELTNTIKTNSLVHNIIIFDQSQKLLFPIILPQEQQMVAMQWLKLIPNDQEANLQQIASKNWFVWYDQQKEKYIYWQKNSVKTVFIELNNSMFMAELIHFLARQPNKINGAFLQILDNSGRVFYQWGDKKFIDNADIEIQKSFNSPLSGWSLRYFSQIESLSLLSKGLFQIVVIGIILLFSIITFILLKIKKREQLEAQQRLSFINQVSHELKTPLTNIRLHGDLLDRSFNQDLINENSQQSVTIIRQESERLTRLINNVLNFNKLEKQILKLHYSSIAFDDLMHQSLLPFKPTFDAKNIKIDLKNKNLKLVCVDIDVVKQIIGNLLSNIEKYASSSKKISLLANKQSSGMIHIIVQDQGNGIPIKLAKKVFDPFYRINSHLTGAAGSGLGLGLARDLARLHGGGLVLLKSQIGAKFKISLEENNA